LNKAILKTGPQEFIQKNWSTDILSFLLQKPLFSNISQKELVEQLEAKKKCYLKLPTWFNTPTIYYPNKLNIEQTSSEIAAKYKARLINGESLLDITGGFGVDSFYFSKMVKVLTHCEVDSNLSQIAAYNFEKLGVTNCRFEAKDGIGFLGEGHQKYHWIYADPSRRNDAKGKVFRLEDCEPNISKNLDFLFRHTDAILLKTAPLLDLTSAIKELENVVEIHVVAIQNEVKEVLFVLKKGTEEPIKIKTVDLRKSGEVHFAFFMDDEKSAKVEYGDPDKYLYVPNAAILKSGGFNSVGMRCSVKKIAPHAHLYTSEKKVDFPGKTFMIKGVHPYHKKTMRAFAHSKANVATRNFPLSVAEVRKKHRIMDGGQDYLFFTTDKEDNKIVVDCFKA